MTLKVLLSSPRPSGPLYGLTVQGSACFHPCCHGDEHTHTSTQPPPPWSASPCTDFSWHKFSLLCRTCRFVSHHVAAFITWMLKYEPGNSVFVIQGDAWGWEEGLVCNSGCATNNCQRYSSGLSGESQMRSEQGWLQRRIQHDLGKSPAVTSHRHLLYIIWLLFVGTCVRGATCSSTQWAPALACAQIKSSTRT